jgi:hypothetical protein
MTVTQVTAQRDVRHQSFTSACFLALPFASLERKLKEAEGAEGSVSPFVCRIFHSGFRLTAFLQIFAGA